MKGQDFKSRTTPGLSDATDVALGPGDRIEYELTTGGRIGAELISSYRQHDNGAYGWEARFDDDGQTGFADEKRIRWWTGKA